MFNQYEACLYVQDALPEFKKELTTVKNDNPYAAMQALADITVYEVNEHNFNMVRRCFDIAEKLYNRGNNAVKNAVENVFVYSSFTTILHCPDKKKILAIIPITLYTLYINQLHAGGC